MCRYFSDKLLGGKEVFSMYVYVDGNDDIKRYLRGDYTITLIRTKMCVHFMRKRKESVGTSLSRLLSDVRCIMSRVGAAPLASYLEYKTWNASQIASASTRHPSPLALKLRHLNIIYIMAFYQLAFFLSPALPRVAFQIDQEK